MRENFRFRKNKFFEFFIIILEKVPGLGNGLGCNTQASGAPNDGVFMPNHVFFMSNQRFALPKAGLRCQNLSWAADILTAVRKHILPRSIPCTMSYGVLVQFLVDPLMLKFSSKTSNFGKIHNCNYWMRQRFKVELPGTRDGRGLLAFSPALFT